MTVHSRKCSSCSFLQPWCFFVIQNLTVDYLEIESGGSSGFSCIRYDHDYENVGD